MVNYIQKKEKIFFLGYTFSTIGDSYALMQRNHCQSEFNNHFSYEVLANRYRWNLLVTSYYHIYWCAERDKFGLSMILKSGNLNHNMIQKSMW